MLRDFTGSRGERIVEVRLTKRHDSSDRPLFRPAFLGDKWPAIDFYVELETPLGRRPYFFAQVKSTAGQLSPRATHLAVSGRREDVARLLQIPGPTYLLGVHEPSERVFVRSVHTGVPLRAITRIQGDRMWLTTRSPDEPRTEGTPTPSAALATAADNGAYVTV